MNRKQELKKIAFVLKNKGYNKLATRLRRVSADMITPRINAKDSLLSGIAWEDLIDMVYSNEPKDKIDAAMVMRTFTGMMQANIKDAKATLKKNVKRVVELAKEG